MYHLDYRINSKLCTVHLQIFITSIKSHITDLIRYRNNSIILFNIVPPNSQMNTHTFFTLILNLLISLLKQFRIIILQLSHLKPFNNFFFYIFKVMFLFKMGLNSEDISIIDTHVEKVEKIYFDSTLFIFFLICFFSYQFIVDYIETVAAIILK